MSTYIVPQEGNFDALTELTQRAGVTQITPKALRELVIEDAQNSVLVGALNTEHILILNRYASQLLEEVPTVVIGVPGLAYSGEWYTLAASFPPIDWSEFEKKLAKSGSTAYTKEDLEVRSVSAPVREDEPEVENSDPIDVDF